MKTPCKTCGTLTWLDFCGPGCTGVYALWLLQILIELQEE